MGDLWGLQAGWLIVDFGRSVETAAFPLAAASLSHAGPAVYIMVVLDTPGPHAPNNTPSSFRSGASRVWAGRSRHWQALRAYHARRVVLRLWLRVPETREDVLVHLSRSETLGTSMRAGGSGSAYRHNDYLQKLRVGTRAALNVIASRAYVAAEAHRIASSLAADTGLGHGPQQLEGRIAAASGGGVVTEVADEAELSALELWQQGDASLYTQELLERRARLRRDPRVSAALNLWWETAVRGDWVEEGWSLDGSGGPDAGSTGSIGFKGYSAYLSRIYRVILRDYQPKASASAIEKDWREDCRGDDRLTRTRFLDSLFELADLWTAGICPYQVTSAPLPLPGD